MKKVFVFTSLAAAALISTAAAQTTDTPAYSSEAQSFRAPIAGPRPQEPRTPPAPIDRSGAVGSVQRAARHGNPLELLNPRAPAEKYGTAEENTSFDPNEPGKPKGFKLFAWVF